MPIKVQCPNGHRLNAPEKLIGKTVKCPKCKAAVKIAVVKTAEVQPPVEAIAVTPGDPSASQPETGDFYTDPFAQLDLASEFANIPPVDPMSAGNLGAGQVAGANNNPWQAQAKTPAKGEQTRKKTSKKGNAKENTVPWIAIAAGSLSFLALIVIVLVFVWPSGSTSSSTGVAANESELLLEHLAQGKAPPEIARAFEDNEQRENLRQLFSSVWPDHLRLSKERENLLHRGENDPQSLAHFALLTDHLSEDSRSRANYDAFGDSAVANELKYQFAAGYWRLHLLNIETATREQWENIARVENEVFGASSLMTQLDSEEWKDLRGAYQLEYNLTQIGNAFRHARRMNWSFHEGLSWRVAVLPALGEQELFEKFKLDEPWDSANNSKLVDQIPKIFANTETAGTTTIHAVRGKDTFYSGVPSHSFMTPDGPEYTLLMIVGGPETQAIWTKPDGIEFDESRGADQYGSPPYSFGYPAIMVQGLPKEIPADLPAEAFGKLVRIDDGFPEVQDLRETVPSIHPLDTVPSYRFMKRTGSTPSDFSLSRMDLLMINLVAIEPRTATWPATARSARNYLPQLKPKDSEVAAESNRASNANRGTKSQASTTTQSSTASQSPASTAGGSTSKENESKDTRVAIFGYDRNMRSLLADYLRANEVSKIKASLCVIQVESKLRAAVSELGLEPNAEGQIEFPESLSSFREKFDSGNLLQEKELADLIPANFVALKNDYQENNLSDVEKEIAFIVFCAFLLSATD